MTLAIRSQNYAVDYQTDVEQLIKAGENNTLLQNGTDSGVDMVGNATTLP